MKAVSLLVPIFLLAQSCSKPGLVDVHRQTPSQNVLVSELPISCDNKTFSDKDLNLAALDNLYGKVIHLDGEATAEQIATARKRLAELRDWNATLDNRRIREAYEYWLRFYAGQYDELETKLLTKADTQEEIREKSRRAEEARAAELAKCLPTPLKKGPTE